MIKKILPISIVIPSIGEDFLLPNVLKLLSDDVYEFSEILIIIPESFKKKEHKNFNCSHSN